jgi:hypothetical protein
MKVAAALLLWFVVESGGPNTGTPRPVRKPKSPLNKRIAAARLVLQT